jgi:hypothetical protein
MKRVIAQIGFLAALVGCVSDAPLSAEPYETRQFKYRGGALGGDCSVAREFEAQGGVPEVHNTLDPLDQYGFVQSRNRVALLHCRNGVLCSQSITFLLEDSSAASELCEDLRRQFAATLGTPTFDTHSWGNDPPSEVQSFWDEGGMRPVSWKLSQSELLLDCPLEPNGEGLWSVSTSHTTDPQLASQRSESGTLTVAPARACLTAQ